MRSILAVAVVAAASLGLALRAPAALAYTVPDGTAGTQTFDGALGMDFDVIGPAGIRVTRLGAFDSGQDGLASTINVGIFDRTTMTLVGSSVALSGTDGSLEGGHRVVSLGTPIDLAPGFQGTIVGQGYNAAEPNGNVGTGSTAGGTDDGGGLISFVGASRFGPGGVFDFPTSLDGGPANRYHAGTFDFAAIPEPSVSTLMMGCAALFFFRRRRTA